MLCGKLQLVVAKRRNRAYETPENIRSDLATDQIKAFRENPCRGIARLAATATKHDLYIALVLRVRDRVFQRIVATILNYGGSNAPASLILSAEFFARSASGE